MVLPTATQPWSSSAKSYAVIVSSSNVIGSVPLTTSSGPGNGVGRGVGLTKPGGTPASVGVACGDAATGCGGSAGESHAVHARATRKEITRVADGHAARWAGPLVDRCLMVRGG